MAYTGVPASRLCRLDATYRACPCRTRGSGPLAYCSVGTPPASGGPCARHPLPGTRSVHGLRHRMEAGAFPAPATTVVRGIAGVLQFCWLVGANQHPPHRTTANAQGGGDTRLAPVTGSVQRKGGCLLLLVQRTDTTHCAPYLLEGNSPPIVARVFAIVVAALFAIGWLIIFG